jgi:hypothetical protein
VRDIYKQNVREDDDLLASVSQLVSALRALASQLQLLTSVEVVLEERGKNFSTSFSLF